MGVPIRVLMVEDSEDDAALLLQLLRQGGYEIDSARVDSASGMTRALNQKWDIVISDHSMPQFSGTEALKMLKARDAEVPFIFVSGTIGEDAATDAMRVGAQDYVMKTNLKRLCPAVHRRRYRGPGSGGARSASHAGGFHASGAGDHESLPEREGCHGGRRTTPH